MYLVEFGQARALYNRFPHKLTVIEAFKKQIPTEFHGSLIHEVLLSPNWEYIHKYFEGTSMTTLFAGLIKFTKLEVED